MNRLGRHEMDAPYKALAWVLLLAVHTASFGCGSGPVIEDEDWMIGTFSTGTIPCNYGDHIWRYVVHEDGRFDIITVYANTLELKSQARWEQREPGRIRVMRDEAHLEPAPYPILEGVEWEITRSVECVHASNDEGFNHVWHQIDEVELDTGKRRSYAGMTPGSMCITLDEDECGQWPLSYVTWCEGTEPPPDCAVE